jgi:hypothetical protein
MFGHVFTVGNKVEEKSDIIEVEGDDVLALVDADGKSCIPDRVILSTVNLRIFLTSSPRVQHDKNWLTQNVHDEHASYVVRPWHWEECAIASCVTSVSSILSIYC